MANVLYCQTEFALYTFVLAIKTLPKRLPRAGSLEFLERTIQLTALQVILIGTFSFAVYETFQNYKLWYHISGLKKTGGFDNLMPAPAHLITPDYPGLNRDKPSPPVANTGSDNGATGYCPGGALQECIRFCPSGDGDSGQAFAQCVNNCGQSCST